MCTSDILYLFFLNLYKFVHNKKSKIGWGVRFWENVPYCSSLKSLLNDSLGRLTKRDPTSYWICCGKCDGASTFCFCFWFWCTTHSKIVEQNEKKQPPTFFATTHCQFYFYLSCNDLDTRPKRTSQVRFIRQEISYTNLIPIWCPGWL